MQHNDILTILKDAIMQVTDDICDYAVNPDTDFTQKGKRSPQILLFFLIGHGSKITRNERIEAFNGDKDHPTAPALVQKHAKLLPSALSQVLYRFNQCFQVASSHADSNSDPDVDSVPEYRFYTADGSTFSFLSDSRFPRTNITRPGEF